MNLKVPAELIKNTLRRSWNTTQPLPNFPDQEIAVLAREKYSRPEWNRKF
jgi:hypothetical protein